MAHGANYKENEKDGGDWHIKFFGRNTTQAGVGGWIWCMERHL